MANIVYGAPYMPPAPPVSPWAGLPMTWTAKGSEWALTDRGTGITMLPGLRGLGSVRSDRHSTASPGVPGSRHEGVSFLDREVFWPLLVWHDGGSLDWMQRDREFWRTMDPLQPGTWTVHLPDGTKRSLRIRFTSDGDKASTIDPMQVGWDSYGITFVAEQPFWVGTPIVNSFVGFAEPAPFFEPTGPQLVNIASSYSAANATIDNPGDVESYPRWYIDGETTAVTVGVGSETVTVPFTIPAATCLIIESDPDNIGATLYDMTASGVNKKPSERIVGVDLVNGVDMSRHLGESDFAPIPPGTKVPLSVEITGSGKVEVEIPTLYRRAW